MKLLIRLLFIIFTCQSLMAQRGNAAQLNATKTLLTEFNYAYKGESRNVPLKIYYSGDKFLKNAPVILMSHGLGGSREIGSYLGKHWAEHGFVVVAIEHEGSDRDILTGLKRKDYIRAMKKAMSMENFFNRVHDVPATIDQISRWNTEKSHPLYQKLNLDALGMSGHSFGAVTTQSVSGQNHPIVGKKYTDQRVKAAFAMSPSSSRMRGKPNTIEAGKAFSKVSIPWLLMTGTKDKVFLAPHVNVKNRKLVYSSLPKGDKYQLVLEGASHMAFSDRTMLGQNHRNPKHHDAIKKISTTFFQAYLKNDRKAKDWLQSAAVEKILQKKDTWEYK